MKRKPKYQFPDMVFVRQEFPANDDPYLVVHEDVADAAEEAGHGEAVAVYQLVRTGTAEITRGRLKGMLDK